MPELSIGRGRPDPVGSMETEPESGLVVSGDILVIELTGHHRDDDRHHDDRNTRQYPDGFLWTADISTSRLVGPP
jgi:hypothetical protein